MRTNKLISEIEVGMTDWTCKVRLQEKLHPFTPPSKPALRLQKMIFVDENGTRVLAILWNRCIDLFKNRLEVYKSYCITNAIVQEAAPNFRIDNLSTQWNLTSRTITEEAGESIHDTLPADFLLTSFSDLPKFVEREVDIDMLAVVIAVMPALSRTKKNGNEALIREVIVADEELKPIMLTLWDDFAREEGSQLEQLKSSFPVVICRRIRAVSFNSISLKTRYSSTILINQPTTRATELKKWAQHSEKDLLEMVANRDYNKHDLALSFTPDQKISPIAEIIPTDPLIWVMAKLSFAHIEQKYWYMACDQCSFATSAKYGWQFTCNNCRNSCKAVPRCRFNVDLSDNSGAITVSAFDHVAEKILLVDAVQAMNLSSGEEHDAVVVANAALKDKEFIVLIRSANNKPNNSQLQYTLHCYFDSTRQIPEENNVADQSTHDISFSRARTSNVSTSTDLITTGVSKISNVKGKEEIDSTDMNPLKKAKFQ